MSSSAAFAGSVNLAWDPVSSTSLAGYKLHYGAAAGSYTAVVDVGNSTTYTMANLTDGATYHFAVTAYDTTGTESGYSNDVVATVPSAVPVAQFSASTTTGVAPLALNFINGSTGNITSYAWTFGDGTTSTVQSPSHTYSAAGSYTVSLTVTGPGGSNTQTRSGYINVSTSSSATAPVAGFTVNTSTGLAPLAVTFTNTSTGTVSSYAWNFGDGGTSTAASPLHTYKTPGTYTAKLTVSNSAGSSTKSVTITATSSTTSGTCPCTLFSTSVPKVSADPDGSAVELGMKFKADRSGYVTAVRFYKSSTNTGTHVGSLWSTSGSLLGRVTFSSETASGWQTAYFSTPVAINANTTYVVSYHTNVGHYAGDNGYFSNAVDRAPLHALSNSVTGGNGVYKYGSTPGFPTSNYKATNYWVDVVFQ